MTPNPSAPILKREFAGSSFEVPGVFVPGDTLDATAAAWINGQLATVIGNAFGGILRRAEKAGKPIDKDNYGALFASTYADYSLSGNRGTGAPKASADPVTRLMRELATAEVKAKIVAKRLKVKDFMDAKVTHVGTEMSKLQSLILQFTAANEDSLRARAEAALDATSETSTDDLDISLEPETAEAA